MCRGFVRIWRSPTPAAKDRQGVVPSVTDFGADGMFPCRSVQAGALKHCLETHAFVASDPEGDRRNVPCGLEAYVPSVTGFVTGFSPAAPGRSQALLIFFMPQQ